MTEQGRPGIRSGADIATAARFMLSWDSDRLEVYEKDALIGEITRSDLIRFLSEGHNLYDTNVGELLNRLGRIDRLVPDRREVA